MKNYNVFKHLDGRIEIVKQGWSWPAFVLELFGLSFIWALVKKLWFIAALLIIFRIVMLIISNSMTPDVDHYSNYYEYQRAVESLLNYSLLFLFIQLGVAVFIGIKGNAFREKNLILREFQLIGMVSALNPDMAMDEIKKAESQNVNSNNSDIISPM